MHSQFRQWVNDPPMANQPRRSKRATNLFPTLPYISTASCVTFSASMNDSKDCDGIFFVDESLHNNAASNGRAINATMQKTILKKRPSKFQVDPHVSSNNLYKTEERYSNHNDIKISSAEAESFRQEPEEHTNNVWDGKFKKIVMVLRKKILLDLARQFGRRVEHDRLFSCLGKLTKYEIFYSLNFFLSYQKLLFVRGQML